jgi:hypothetical protein
MPQTNTTQNKKPKPILTRRSDHRYLRRLIIFALLATATTGLSIFGLIRNSSGAVERYNKLIAVDQAGGNVEEALDGLRTYIYSHMNTEIGGPNGIYPPIQLSGTYSRLVAAEEARVEGVNDELYSEAQAHCEEHGSQGFSGGNRIDCINEYIDTNGAEVQPIDDSLYKYDFVAPRWSADLAGISMVSAILFALLALFNLLMYTSTRYMVHSAN